MKIYFQWDRTENSSCRGKQPPETAADYAEANLEALEWLWAWSESNYWWMLEEEEKDVSSRAERVSYFPENLSISLSL